MMKNLEVLYIMKKNKITEQFEFLDEHFSVTKHFGSELIEISKLEKKRFGGYYYKTIYFGHVNPIKEALEFFDKSITPQQG